MPTTQELKRACKALDAQIAEGKGRSKRWRRSGWLQSKPGGKRRSGSRCNWLRKPGHARRRYEHVRSDINFEKWGEKEPHTKQMCGCEDKGLT